jgi:molybdopterin-containing oxidoreductase family iron-sulfur binding subunit
MPLTEMLIHWKNYRKSGQVGDELHPHEIKWGMSIDLDICTGCSACVTACYAENNLPVVGKERFARGLAMHWLRMEHYWNEGDEDAAQPRFPEQGAQHIPMMCQQCEHAPCEPVCPVAATYHTPDGLNAQVYNRCVGSRYCSNNCPYKVRYFNFYSYSEDIASPLEMQLNPDLTVRDKGVMEKCTFCVQRTRRAKNDAKNENRDVRDGDVQTACQQACPTQAIVFGNLSDPDSRVAQSWKAHKMAFGNVEHAGEAKQERGYRVFEQLNTEPSVTYLERVRDDEI